MSWSYQHRWQEKKAVNIFREIKEGIMSLEQKQAALKKNSWKLKRIESKQTNNFKSRNSWKKENFPEYKTERLGKMT